MGETKIKLCGMFRSEDIVYANQVRPDYVGFILTSGFRRSITKEQAVQFRQKLDPEIPAVGVFVDAPCEEILSFIEKDIIQMIQLHGKETEEDVMALKVFGKPVIKVIKAQKRQDVEAGLGAAADYLLFDSGTGTGRVFDWDLLTEVHRPYFLAGGLHVGNLKSAIARLHPYVVDVSSGVETNGVKDKAKMQELVELVRGGIETG